jgi:hypothetical protein
MLLHVKIATCQKTNKNNTDDVLRQFRTTSSEHEMAFGGVAWAGIHKAIYGKTNPIDLDKFQSDLGGPNNPRVPACSEPADGSTILTQRSQRHS